MTNATQKQILIDRFVIPATAKKEEFLQRMNYNRNFIKELPGFVQDNAYQQTDENGNLIIVTVAVWQDAQSINNAKAAVQDEYKKTGFDPFVFTQSLNIQMERGLYEEMGEL